MRRPVAFVLCALFLVEAVALPAVSRGEFDRVVDFSVTLKTLAAVAEGKVTLPTGRMLLLSGTVSSVTRVNPDQAGFKVRIELITGEWIGLEDVKAYACYVDYSGPEFFAIFPARAPAGGAAGLVLQNSRVIVAGQAVTVTTTPLGERRVVLDGAYIRVIE